MDESLYSLLNGATLLVLSVVVFLFAKWVNDLITPYSVDIELATNDNPALAISFAGYLLGVAIIYVGALWGPSQGIVFDLLLVGGYSLGGILLLNLARIINDKVLFPQFSNVKEIIEDRNCGTGAVQFGSYVASALVIAGAVQGQGGGPHTALAFYLAGQIVLIVFVRCYDLLTPFKLHDEIERDNVAAGVACAGGQIGIGIVLMHASAGDFVGWAQNFNVFAMEAAVVLILLPLVRYFFDKAILFGIDLNHEIAHDQNIGAAFIEATAMIGFSAILVVLVT